jgi:hypothetical protein
MNENRTERVSVSLTPGTAAQLDVYARAHHWSRSTAVAVLVQSCLNQQGDNGTEEGDDLR